MKIPLVNYCFFFLAKLNIKSLQRQELVINMQLECNVIYHERSYSFIDYLKH